MARPKRLERAGGIYHVIARGNRRQPIIEDERDSRRILHYVDDVVTRCVWRCHAYCLMPNHFHLLLETPEPNLSIGMQRLNGSYAQWFNRRHNVDGHLFQGRYHAVLIESNWHLLELSRYIVLNPVRAGLCAEPAAWVWSSYRATIGELRRPRFLRLEWLLGQFGSDLAKARASYAQFVREGMPPRR